MKYLLDFDRTVFDMEGLYQSIEQHNPGVDLGTPASLKGIDLEQFLFPDALDFFSTHDAADIEIVSSGFGLTGQWEVAYQTKKIELSGIAKYVHAIHVVPDSKISMIKRIASESDTVTYVDDHPENVASAVQHISGLTVVYLDRSGGQVAVAGAKTIDTLSALDASIKSS
jgi:hypothetical protein